MQAGVVGLNKTTKRGFFASLHSIKMSKRLLIFVRNILFRIRINRKTTLCLLIELLRLYGEESLSKTNSSLRSSNIDFDQKIAYKII